MIADALALIIQTVLALFAVGFIIKALDKGGKDAWR